MLSQNQIKHITALKVKKFREEHRQFIAEGHKLVMDMLSSEFQVAGIYASSQWIITNLPVIRGKDIPVFETLPREMERLTALSNPSQVLAVVNIPPERPTKPAVADLVGASANRHHSLLVLALDDIRDPGNLGTIIRIADWFGLDAVLCSFNCADVFNPKVVQATMGSIARVKLIRCDLADALQQIAASGAQAGSMTPIPVFGTFLEGDSVFSQTLSDHGVVVIGNESRGISPELVPFITQKLFIPSYGPSLSGKAESLNASIATAIICAEFRKNKF